MEFKKLKESVALSSPNLVAMDIENPTNFVTGLTTLKNYLDVFSYIVSEYGDDESLGQYLSEVEGTGAVARTKAQLFIEKYLISRYDKYLSPEAIKYMLIANQKPFFIIPSFGETIDYCTMLKESLVAKFYVKWDKLYKTTIQSYNMIENYDRNEDLDSTRTPNLTSTSKGSSKSKVYAFNSINSVDDAESLADSESTATGTEKVKQINHVHGNIGVTTNQQMIQSERDLWMWNLVDAFYKDLDEFLFLEVM